MFLYTVLKLLSNFSFELIVRFKVRVASEYGTDQKTFSETNSTLSALSGLKVSYFGFVSIEKSRDSLPENVRVANLSWLVEEPASLCATTSMMYQVAGCKSWIMNSVWMGKLKEQIFSNIFKSSLV